MSDLIRLGAAQNEVIMDYLGDLPDSLFLEILQNVKSLGPVPERRNSSIPAGINVPYFRGNFIPGINSVPGRRNSAIKGINQGPVPERRNKLYHV